MQEATSAIFLIALQAAATHQAGSFFLLKKGINHLTISEKLRRSSQPVAAAPATNMVLYALDRQE